MKIKIINPKHHDDPISVELKVPLRLWLEAALIAVILAWSAINGFWILTHAW